MISYVSHNGLVGDLLHESFGGLVDNLVQKSFWIVYNLV